MRRKKKKKDLLKKSINVIKKSSELERKKSEEKKMKKKNKPKGMGMKKLGMITFWILFSFMFLVTIVNIFGSSSDSLDEAKIEQNKLFDNEGLEFAKEFVYYYFTWATDKHAKDKREANLEPYFLDGLDSLGGIVFDNEWASSIDKRDIVLKEIREINENQARYIFKVKFTQKSKTDEDDTKIDPNELDFDELMEKEQQIKVVDGYKTVELERFISVPIYYDEKTDRFAVFDLPSFTYIEDGEKDFDFNNNLSKLRVLSDSFVENNVIAFLDTFFESYTKDSRDKLSYILEDEKHQSGLNGTMEFSEIEDAKIYQLDENNNRFVVDAKVLLQDPKTKFEYTNKYLVVINRKDQRYVVESLNDERYVDELIEKYIQEQDGKETDNDDSNDSPVEEDEEDNEDFYYQDVDNKNEVEDTDEPDELEEDDDVEKNAEEETESDED